MSPAVYLPLIFVPGLLLFGIIAFVIRSFNLEHPLVPALGYLCTGVMSVGLVLGTIQPRGLLRSVLSFRPLVSVGVISYGLYIFHGFLMSAFSHHQEAFQKMPVLLPVTAFAVTFSVAWISYRFYEQPFLRLKDRWAPTRPVAVSGRDPAARMSRTL